jgi:AhpD family alkylhydroperoxidase
MHAEEQRMAQRLNWMGRTNKGVEALRAVEAWLARGSGLDAGLLHLVKMRASQINGCAFCLHMHSGDALAAGERVERLLLLDAWRESALFTDRERAALAWTEAVTRVAETRVSDDVYEEVRPHFTEEELLSLTFEVIVINSWNRLAIASRAVAGAYQPQQAVA